MHDISRLQAWCYVTHRGKRFPKYHEKVVLILRLACNRVTGNFWVFAILSVLFTI